MEKIKVRDDAVMTYQMGELLIERVKKAAGKIGTNSSQLVRVAVEKYLKRVEAWVAKKNLEEKQSKGAAKGAKA